MSDLTNGQLFNLVSGNEITGESTYDIWRSLEGNENKTQAEFIEFMQLGAAGLEIDDELSTTSTNPVQNKVVTEKFSQLEEQIGDQYAKKTEIPLVPVQSVNGKTGGVLLTADDVGATTEDWVKAKLEDLKAQGIQQVPLFANSVDECTDTTKMYVLPDGYIYAYLYTEITVEPENEIPKSTDTDRTTIYNGIGYQMGMRINSSGSVVTHTDTAMGVTGFIPAKVGDVIEASNYDRNTAYTTYMAAYDSENACTGKLTLNASNVSANSFSITLDETTFGSNFDSIRVAGNLTDATSIINKSNGGTTSDYAWTNTGFAFIPADYEERIIELEREVAELEKIPKQTNILGISEVFAPSPQLPADGSGIADFNGDKDSITAEQIYAKIDELLNLYPRFITKEVLGKDESGTHDWHRYTCSRRAYDAWLTPNYPAMYAWVNGSTVIYSVSVSPRIGDTMYSTAYIGTVYNTVTAVDNANQARTVNSLVFTRDSTQDVEPTLVYTETTYSPYFSSNYAGYKNGVYDSNKSNISTISDITDGIMTDANSVSYTRYPLGDRNSKFEEIPAIVIGANEHGTGGDPATPAMITARMIKDLCECTNAQNPFLNLLKNDYMMVFCPVVNPWGLHKDNQAYYNSNGVNLDRNFDTIGWGNDTTYPQGDYGGSENETQYFMNTLVSSKCKFAMCNHSYGEGREWNNGVEGEAVSGGICSYMLGGERPQYTESLLEIAEVMSANYNLVFNKNSDTATPETSAKTRSYFEAIGIDGIALEINSRDGFITDPNNESQGKQFTARVMEAGYTQLLQTLYMLIKHAE